VARCFVTRALPGPALDRLRAEHEVDVWPGDEPPTAVRLAAQSANAHGLLSLLTDRVDTALLDACPELRAIANYAVGYDNIDLEATRARGIPVGNTPDVLTEATADLAFALLLAAARGLNAAEISVRADQWRTWEPAAYLGRDVHGATLGIVGMGRIGQAVAARAAGFDMEVIHHDMEVIDAGRSGVSFPALLARADFISLHCPLTADTHHLINEAALIEMKPTAILINTARGPIVDQVALREALKAGQIAGAALDVTDPEPMRADDPLLTAPNLIVVPHIGSATITARHTMAELAVDNLLAALAGEPMPHPVG